MLQSVTPWTATVPSDIQSSDSLIQMDHCGYDFNLYNSGDSVWLTAHWPNAAQIAFRLAFGMNSNFQHFTVNKIDSGILITTSTRLGNYRIVIAFPNENQSLFRYTTTFRASFPMLIPFWPRDIVPVTKGGRVENTTGILHTHQVGGRSGHLFFSMTKPQKASVFYFQNLSAMSPYCEASQTSLAETVGGQWPEIGFQFPVNKEKPLPSDTEYVISDAFVILDDKVPQSDSEKTQQFLDYFASVYLLLPKPEPKYNDWTKISKNVLNDLLNNKGCWTQTGGVPYLNAYVGDYRTPAEIMVQLSVLLPLREYLEWCGEKHQLFDDLNSGLEAFYNDSVKSIVRWHPDLEDDLDNSEEQKREMVMDSWYLHHPLLNLSRLAIKGDSKAKELFLGSIDFAINVAHHFNYEWPVFYKMTTLEVIKAETSPGNGGEKDVPGSYAHIMLMAWKLTKNKRYFKEAIKAIEMLKGLAFDIFYQANNTAFAAGALIELYKETENKKYLDLSYCCLAGIFKNTQVWECNYGHGKNFPNFFSVFPLNDAPYTAAYEELEVYTALHNYLLIADGVEILPSLKILIPEFLKYASGRLAYYYPPMLPEDMIAKEIKTGEVQKDLWVPLEDIYDGWEQSGQVGQEVYGSGLAFGIVPRQYIRLDDDRMIFVDYPITKLRKSRKNLIFHVIGDADLQCNIRLLNFSKSMLEKAKVEFKPLNSYIAANTTDERNLFSVNANSVVRIQMP
jgi:hypothetical protein